jgi:hypothetical protein
LLLIREREETYDLQTIPDGERLFRYDGKFQATDIQIALTSITSRLLDVSIPNLRLCLGRLSFARSPRSCEYRIGGLNSFALFGEAFIFSIVRVNCLITLVRGFGIRIQVLRVSAAYSDSMNCSFIASDSNLFEGKLKYS